MVDYEIKYSKRKTVAIYITSDGKVEVRCPKIFALVIGIGGPVVSIQMLIGNIPILPLDDFTVVLVLYAVFSWYYIFWNITAFAEVFRERKAQKRGGKK